MWSASRRASARTRAWRRSRAAWRRWSAPRTSPPSPATPPDDRLVVYVGKLIASKGVELLLAAWPLIHAREPRARLLVVGFGAFRDGLRGLAEALARGDLDAARATRGENGE